MSSRGHRLRVDLARFGRAIRALRRRRGWRQGDLAAASHLSRAQVGRIERGEARRLPIDAFAAVASATGASAELVLRWRGEGLDRLLDEEHARLVELVVRRLTALSWECAVEVSFSRYGERGSIDVLAWHAATRALLVIEVKSVTPDMQAMLGGLDRKGRLAPVIARERGWDPRVVARVLVLADTSTNRRRLAAHAGTVAASLPAGTREVLRWVAAPLGPAIAGVWFLADAGGADRTLRQRHRVRRSSMPPRTAKPPAPGRGPPRGP